MKRMRQLAGHRGSGDALAAAAVVVRPRPRRTALSDGPRLHRRRPADLAGERHRLGAGGRRRHGLRRRHLLPAPTRRTVARGSADRGVRARPASTPRRAARLVPAERHALGRHGDGPRAHRRRPTARTLYIGGNFSNVARHRRRPPRGARHRDLHRPQPRSSHRPSRLRSARSAATHGIAVYFGGDFTTVAGQPRQRVRRRSTRPTRRCCRARRTPSCPAARSRRARTAHRRDRR